jgi:hypothetical protein
MSYLDGACIEMNELQLAILIRMQINVMIVIVNKKLAIVIVIVRMLKLIAKQSA